MPEPPRERITKLDAIQRQLRTAIRLFFEERDVFPIFTLAAACQDLLRDLLRPSGRGSFIKDSKIIRPERIKEFRDIIRRPQNFLKHADSDPEEILEFNPRTLDYVLFDCVLMYQVHTERRLREGFVFEMWFYDAYPDVLLDGEYKDKVRLALKKLGIRLNKRLFLQALDLPDLRETLMSNFD